MLGALVLLVLLIHVARVWDQPIRGEESRWAEGGIEMLRGGDWIVPTQQGTVFPERPPLNSWLMAIFSVALGEMSPLAVRLPSVLAVVGTAALIYGYLRRWLPASGAFLGGGVFATMGQVLQLGHLGESEAVLTALIGLSLLGWHDAWLDGRETRAWLIGFSAAGFAALTKGLQGPIYFVAVSGMFLLLQGWREPLRVLRTKGAWLGLASMALIIGAWAIPFWLRTDGATMRAIWTGLVADRVTLSGLAQHLGSYPLELLGCLLPWSLFLIPLAQRDVREVLGRYSPAVRFALLALAVTFPSVWLVTGARGRYYMPLYPVAAVGLALVAWSTWQGVRTSTTQRAWWRFVLVIGLISMGLGGVIGLGPIFSDAVLVPAAAPIGASLVGVICLLLGITLCGLVWLSRQRSGSEPVAEQRSNRRWVFASLLGVLLALGWIDGAFIVSRDLEHGDVVWSEVESLRQALPADTDLVSFGPVHHRFMYHWRDAIELRSWPESCDVIPPGDYFVIDYTPGDTPEKRASGRGRDWSFTSGTLPFRWELVRAIPLDREYQASGNWVLVGRVLRNDSGAVIATAQGVPSFESLTR
ncbi:MAG: glycosyltransferase family 39 protein [Planctomycetales bacterium]|nr:glycosyltransferase family 39 protein [Planctomycetales bacterium]